MSLIPPQVRIGVAASVALAIALAAGTAGFIGAWKWRSGDVARAEKRLSELSSALREAERVDAVRASEASRRIAEQDRTLQAQLQLERFRGKQFIKQLDDAQSRARVCLTGRTLRVLRSAQDRGAEQGADPALDAGAAPGSAAAAGGGPGRGLSESAASRYLALCMSRYREAQLRYVSLVRKVEDLPCVEIVEDE